MMHFYLQPRIRTSLRSPLGCHTHHLLLVLYNGHDQPILQFQSGTPSSKKTLFMTLLIWLIGVIEQPRIMRNTFTFCEDESLLVFPLSNSKQKGCPILLRTVLGFPKGCL